MAFYAAATNLFPSGLFSKKLLIRLLGEIKAFPYFKIFLWGFASSYKLDKVSYYCGKLAFLLERLSSPLNRCDADKTIRNLSVSIYTDFEML